MPTDSVYVDLGIHIFSSLGKSEAAEP